MPQLLPAQMACHALETRKLLLLTHGFYIGIMEKNMETRGTFLKEYIYIYIYIYIHIFFIGVVLGKNIGRAEKENGNYYNGLKRLRV